MNWIQKNQKLIEIKKNSKKKLENLSIKNYIKKAKNLFDDEKINKIKNNSMSLNHLEIKSDDPNKPSKIQEMTSTEN